MTTTTTDTTFNQQADTAIIACLAALAVHRYEKDVINVQIVDQPRSPLMRLLRDVYATGGRQQADAELTFARDVEQQVQRLAKAIEADNPLEAVAELLAIKTLLNGRIIDLLEQGHDKAVAGATEP